MRSKIDLTEEKIRVSMSMDKYWQEIVDRDNPEQVCTNEIISSVIPILGAKNILLILHDYVNKVAPENNQQVLKYAVELIRRWHGIRTVHGEDIEKKMWEIYYSKSPEMKPIREVLDGASKIVTAE